MDKVCQHCGTINNASNPVCTKCGYPFDNDLEAAVKNKKWHLITHKELKKPSYMLLWYIIFFVIAITIYQGLFHYIPKAYELYIGSVSDLTNNIQSIINSGNISDTIKNIMYYTITSVIPLLIGYYLVTIITRYFAFKSYTVLYDKINIFMLDVFLLYLLYALILSLITLILNGNFVEVFLKNLIPLVIYLPLIKKTLVRDYILS